MMSIDRVRVENQLEEEEDKEEQGKEEWEEMIFIEEIVEFEVTDEDNIIIVDPNCTLFKIFWYCFLCLIFQQWVN